MRGSLQQFFKLLWKSLLFWGIAMGLFGVFRYYGVTDSEGVALAGRFVKTNFSKLIFHHIVTGLSIGLLYATIDFVFEKFGPKKLSLGLDLVLKMFVYFIAKFPFTVVTNIYTS